MRLAVLVNRISELAPEQTTALLVARAVGMGFETWLCEVDGLGQEADGSVVGRARRAREGGDAAQALSGLAPWAPLRLEDVDAVLVRTNPARDPQRAWAHQSALLLLRALGGRGVRVVNDPEGLVWATSKLHLSTLPQEIRPRTLVSRDPAALRAFVEQAPGDVVLKPVTGTRGQDVFRVSAARPDNLAQIVDVLARDGLAMAQDYVPEARDGDVRLIVLDGELLRVGDRWAAVRRVPSPADFRSNVAVGGSPAPVEHVTPGMRRAVELAGPVLEAQGLRLAGLDLVGDRVVEVNVFSPGGLFDAERYYGVDFVGAILEALVGPSGR